MATCSPSRDPHRASSCLFSTIRPDYVPNLGMSLSVQCPELARACRKSTVYKITRCTGLWVPSGGHEGLKLEGAAFGLALRTISFSYQPPTTESHPLLWSAPAPLPERSVPRD